MTPQQEAARLKKEFGEKAVKVVDEIIAQWEFAMDYIHRCNPIFALQISDPSFWQQVKSELQKPVNDPFIDEVEEFHPILKKIYAMMRGLEPSIPYSELKVSHLPPPETFAMYPKVGKRSVTHYTDGYEKHRAVPND